MYNKYACIIGFLIITGIGYSKTQDSTNIKINSVPVDTLLNQNISFEKKIILGIIEKWQKFSYSRDHLNCQYYPSCSNYVALSIKDNNTYIGMIKGWDRILRCNPSAKEHFEHNTFNPEYLNDGRMIDHINPIYNFKPSKNPKIATALSVIPGLGRVYCGRYADGALSCYLISLFGYITRIQYYNQNKPLFVLSGAITTTLWMSEFYGAYRAAKTSY